MVRHKGIIEPVKIPGKWVNSHAIELLYDNSRWYVERANASFYHWVREIKDAGIFTIPLQSVSDYVGVSRESVLRRAKTGGLTVFSFVFQDYVKSLIGQRKVRDSKKRFDLVPIEECDQWRDILMDISEYGDFIQDSAERR